MYALFQLQDWLDILHEDQFWPITLLILGVASLGCLTLYSDRVQQYFADRREHLKWIHWNKG